MRSKTERRHTIPLDINVKDYRVLWQTIRADSINELRQIRDSGGRIKNIGISSTPQLSDMNRLSGI
jgi:hypothetical protein